VCDLKAKADKKREQYSFRIMQMQFDVQEGRMEQAKEAQEMAKAAFAECLDIILEHAKEVAKGGSERHSEMFISMADIFGHGGGGTLN